MSLTEAIERPTPTQQRLNLERRERLAKLSMKAVPDSGIRIERASGATWAQQQQAIAAQRAAAKQRRALQIKAKIDAMIESFGAVEVEKTPPIETRIILVDRIQRLISERYGVEKRLLLGSRGNQQLCMARQIAMYLCKRLTLRSLPDIGRRFGGRDHTTVMHAIRKIETMMATDETFAAAVNALAAAIEQGETA